MKVKQIIFILIILCFVHTVNAQYSEEQIKAAFIYNFIEFIEWPKKDKTTDVYIIGILGEDGVTESLLQTHYNILINNKTISIKIFKNMDEITDQVNMLYISKNFAHKNGGLRSITTKLIGTSTVTVSEHEEFCQLGGVINFPKKGARHRFEINTAYNNTCNVKISSKLLSLANLITPYE